MILDDIKIYLPKYLSAESDKELFESLKDFPLNLDQRLYTTFLSDTDFIYQGDGLKEMLIINLPDKTIKPAPSIVISNTCDIDLNNGRFFQSQIVYAPIFNLEKYQRELINANIDSTRVQGHIASIKKQEITQIFYLPELTGQLQESIVFLDRVYNYPNKLVDRDSLKERRIFTLSDYGAYLFLIKLSIHFTRIKDRVERKGFNR